MFTNSLSSPLPSGEGNIETNPVFVQQGSGYGTNLTAGDYRLQRDSPCVNAASNRPWMAGTLDLYGNPRILFGIVDMGCYEFPPPKGSVISLR